MKGGVLIGLFVTISQTIVTTIVLLGFSLLFLGYAFPRGLILIALIYDAIAIVLHMLYRRRERKQGSGKGVKVRKELLIFHAGTSLLAIVSGFYFPSHFFDGPGLLLLITLWLSSFVSGVFVYVEK
jgi:hypothetical protein